MGNKPVFVTAPALAPLEDYCELLKGVWESGILTHNGPLVQKFEKELEKELGISQLVAVTNGTIALQTAIRALGLKGEIITTPFTWIATVSAIQWEGCIPVFADIDRETLNISPEEIRKKITGDTVAIMPVHVFGNPCDIDAIEEIAREFNLKVIYDAAHAVGSTWKGRSILDCGDITATSFHATKILNTAEGGACITRDAGLFEKLRRIRFFGHNEEKEVVDEGLNGKMTEVHAALGLVDLAIFPEILADRKRKYGMYIQGLSSIPGLSFQKVKEPGTNYSYFPVIFESEQRVAGITEKLKKQNIHPRRYFYPSVNGYSRIVPHSPMPVSEDVSARILCLPLSYGIPDETIREIIQIIKYS